MSRRITTAVVICLAALFLARPHGASAAERTEILYIPAITCGSKAIMAEIVIRQVRGVTGAISDVMEAAATVTWDDETVTLEEIMAALGRNGYPVASVGHPPVLEPLPEADEGATGPVPSQAPAHTPAP